ncbi:MAG: hypothetical protein KDI63_02515 [Gammaproteobacteria bacterium]|nr:hypothetical protein [Gammaproteobacteria bacterium]
MTNRRQKEIESLRSRLASLEAQQERELIEQEAMESAHAQMLSSLEEAGITFEAYVRCFVKDFRRVLTKVDREQAKAPPRVRRVTTKKKAAVKKKVRRKKAVVKIKIPAGRYSHLPADPERIFQVKAKGARPKLLKAYADEVGLDTFLSQCFIGED